MKKMTELKTLKDLKWRSQELKDRLDLAIYPTGMKMKNEWFVCEGNLKQEAIKWVKYHNKLVKNGFCLNCMAYSFGMADALKHFFNITEEDLK